MSLLPQPPPSSAPARIRTTPLTERRRPHERRMISFGHVDVAAHKVKTKTKTRTTHTHANTIYIIKYDNFRACCAGGDDGGNGGVSPIVGPFYHYSAVRCENMYECVWVHVHIHRVCHAHFLGRTNDLDLCMRCTS